MAMHQLHPAAVLHRRLLVDAVPVDPACELRPLLVETREHAGFAGPLLARLAVLHAQGVTCSQQLGVRCFNEQEETPAVHP
jgi:hypothetical protein